MRRNGLPITVALLTALLVFACTSSGGGSDAKVGDGAGQEAEQGGCSGLGEEACKASDSCTVIEGWPMPQACLVWNEDPADGLPEFVACVPWGACSSAFTWAHPENEPDKAWLFPSLCTPDGWAKMEEAPCCVPQCEGKECGDDGCGGECGDCGKNQVCAPTGQCECQFHQCGETCCDKDYTSCDDGGCCDPYCGNDCSDTSCLGCLPSCEGDECGDDGCGGTCGICEEGLECLITKFGRRCTTTCEPFTCPEGQLCLFGVCVDQECKTDDDCGGAPEHYCDKFLQCRKRTSCKTWADCKTWNKPHYCDLDVGFCMEDGNCWEDSDCPGGMCGADHWCVGHNCSLPDAPGCPPYMPACDMPEGDMPLCDGQTCGTCIAPCVFDSDCPPGKECQGNWCNAPGNDCILDSECAQGQHCHPGCAALEPTCQTEADCADASGKLCIAGFCGGPNEVLTCKDDAPCLAWREGFTCQDGFCKPEGACVLDSQCMPGQYCHSTCLPIPELPECKTDAGCPAGQICENQDCQVPPECNFHSQCPTGHVCKGQHCYNDQGVCAWMEKGPGFCDDGDPCTVDSCDAVTGCAHAAGGCG